MQPQSRNEKMVRVLEEEKEHFKAKLGQFKGMFDGIRQTKSLVIETNGSSTAADDRLSKSQASSPLQDQANEQFEQTTPPPPSSTAVEKTENVKPARPANESPPPPIPQPKGPPSGKEEHTYMHTCFIYKNIYI